MAVTNQPPPPPPGGGQPSGAPPPTGGLKTDLQTLLHDFLTHADAAQLKADLTTVVADIKNLNSGRGAVNPPAPTPGAMSVMDTTQPAMIVGHS